MIARWWCLRAAVWRVRWARAEAPCWKGEVQVGAFVLGWQRRAVASLVALGLFWPSQVTAQERTTAEKLFIAAVPTYAVLAYKDARGTYDCVKAQVCHEANPVLAPIVDRHGIGVAMGGKLAAQTGIVLFNAWLLERVPRNQQKWVVAGFIAQTALQGYVVHLNRKELGR